MFVPFLGIPGPCNFSPPKTHSLSAPVARLLCLRVAESREMLIALGELAVNCPLRSICASVATILEDELRHATEEPTRRHSRIAHLRASVPVPEQADDAIALTPLWSRIGQI